MTELEWMNIFGDNLKYLMEYTNTSKEELAKWTGIDESTISRYLNKKQMPTIEAIINIADVLGESYDDLLYFEDFVIQKGDTQDDKTRMDGTLRRQS